MQQLAGAMLTALLYGLAGPIMSLLGARGFSFALGLLLCALVCRLLRRKQLA